MTRKKLFDTQKEIPDGEGFNALPIAFVYLFIVIASPIGRSNLLEKREIASSLRFSQ